jgi:periplasmic divalent cation tolerance protein
MRETGKIVIFVTSSSEEEAHKIALTLLNAKKAACVNIVPRIDSSYWWQGKLESHQESLLVIKSEATQLEQIVTLVKSIHSYEVPEIIALPIIGGNPEYLHWIGEVTG